MKPTNFRGRKNARRVNALAEKQHQIHVTENEVRARLQKAATLKPGDERTDNEQRAAYLQSKLTRLQKNADNIAAKVMEQGAAEAVRTKKNRNGSSRKY